MEEQHKIPTGKVQRAAKFLSTGAKVGGNYVKHYTKKMFDPELSREELDKENANDIYSALSQLKGSALKVAQMLSMHTGFLPVAYRDKFAESQHKAPPLSYPLIVKTFRQYTGQNPSEVFDTFSQQAVNAASIGQVHRATKNNQTFAVKIQYPGVAESLNTDLQLVKPVALQLLNITKADLEYYMEEVQSRLIEETDYELELQRSQQISQACSQLPDIVFANYYPQWSGKRVLTMDWIDGVSLKEFAQSQAPQQLRDQIGQALWDFYHYQIHQLRITHADAHPGNFLVTPDNKLGIIDFGCVKEIPDDFYHIYIKGIQPGLIEDDQKLEALLHELDMFRPDDTVEEKQMIRDIFRQITSLVRKPYETEQYDFGNTQIFDSVYAKVEQMSTDKRLRRMNSARGSRHAIYINRTFFGIYSLLIELKANIKTKNYQPSFF